MGCQLSKPQHPPSVVITQPVPSNIGEADHHFRGILIGDSSVGKTSLFKKFIDGIFPEDVISSVGVDFRVKFLNINEKFVKLELWDTAGQERYRSLASSYYKRVDFVVFVYDVTNMNSFKSLDLWSQDVQINAPEKCIKMILANKSDSTYREVDKTFGEKLASTMNALFYEISARDGDPNGPFEDLAKKLIENAKE